MILLPSLFPTQVACCLYRQLFLFILVHLRYNHLMKINYLIYRARHHWQTVAFLGGFVTDILWLNKVDSVLDNATLLFYVFLATISILFLYAGIAVRFGERWSLRARNLAPIIMQYSFGGLFSGILIFYGHSGDILASWPFLILFVAGMVANEVLKRREEKLVFNLTAYFIGIFSYLVLGISVLTGLMGPLIFIGSGIIALTLVYFLVQFLERLIPHYLELQKRAIVFSVFSAFVVLNTLYFTNVIPPIPLSLKEITIAQSVVRFGTGEYKVTYETFSWWNVPAHLHTFFHPSEVGAVFCFTKVFAPTRIKTDIFHVWEFKDPATGDWKEHFKLSYPITGEAVDGYRGYTSIQSFQDGVWRCSVKTARGQVLGRKVFTIDSTQKPKEIETKIE